MKRFFIVAIVCFIVLTMLLISAITTYADVQKTTSQGLNIALNSFATQLSPAGSALTAISNGYSINTGQQAAPNNTSYDAQITTAGATSNIAAAAIPFLRINQNAQNSALNISSSMHTATRFLFSNGTNKNLSVNSMKPGLTLPFRVGTNISLIGIINTINASFAVTESPVGAANCTGFIAILLLGILLLFKKQRSLFSFTYNHGSDRIDVCGA